jgi:hypothetical protein
VWLAITLDDGYRMEYIGGSFDETAWKLNRALTDRLVTRDKKKK